MTGVLQSTLGNLPEFFIVVFALSAGEVVVAQTSIIGSIFANALLVLGVVIVAGCRQSEDGVMRFSPRLPKDNAMLMLLASFLIVDHRHLGRDRRQGFAPRRGDLDRRRRAPCSSPTASWLVDYLRVRRQGRAGRTARRPSR